MKRIAVLLLATLAFFGASAAVAQPDVSEFPLTVTDQIGRTVTLKALPKRIVSGYYISSSACSCAQARGAMIVPEKPQRPAALFAIMIAAVNARKRREPTYRPLPKCCTDIFPDRSGHFPDWGAYRRATQKRRDVSRFYAQRCVPGSPQLPH